MTSSSSSSPEISAATSAEPQKPRFSYKHATHEEVLEDLSSRFILNLPDEELSSLERICFQVEQAHWFYEDFIREQNPNFPSLPLKKFSAMLFHACPLLHQWSHDHEQAFNTFMQYKTRVPVCGAIMLNDTWEKCVLVKGWKSSSGWGFPKGKINEDEPPPTCAIREVLEETGYNLAGKINADDVIELSIREQKISLFIVPGVPEDFPFKTKTRKEISKIEWFKLTDLPTWKRNKAAPGKFYLISPFIGPLKAFINERKPRGMRKKPKTPSPCHSPNESAQESSSQSSSADTGDPQTPSPQYSAATVNHNPHIVDSGLPRPEIPTEPLDPHFARLLSSLTLSASTSLATPDKAESIQYTSIPSSLPTKPSGSERVTRSSVGVISSPIGLVHTESDIHAQKCSSPSPVNPGAISPRSATSRRTSSTADISPYLSRPAEVPRSAKTLKQLALLESVVDESAKLASTLSHRDVALQAMHSSRAPSVISHPPVMNIHHVLYSSNPYPVHEATPSSGSSGLSNISPLNPFQVRPRTSHTPYRVPMHTLSSHSSLNQNKSTAIVNGLQTTPMPYPPLCQSYTQPDGARPATASEKPSLSHVGPTAVLNNASLPLRRSVHTPPTHPRVTATSAVNPSANSLLSILNGRPPPQGISAAIAGPFAGNGRY